MENLKQYFDCEGIILREGDSVEVQAVPDLSGMSETSLKETLPIFEYAVGKRYIINWLEENGLVQLDIEIPKGSHEGLHSIFIEPWLLKKLNE